MTYFLMNFRHILADVIPKLSSDISQNLLEIHSKICHNSKVDIWHELDLKVPDVNTKQNLRYCNLSLGLQPSSATVSYILNIQVQEINTQKVIKIRLSSPKTGQKSENASIWRAKKFPLKMTSSAKKNFSRFDFKIAHSILYTILNVYWDKWVHYTGNVYM